MWFRFAKNEMEQKDLKYVKKLSGVSIYNVRNKIPLTVIRLN
jgi:hypothetical protein